MQSMKRLHSNSSLPRGLVGRDEELAGYADDLKLSREKPCFQLISVCDRQSSLAGFYFAQSRVRTCSTLLTTASVAGDAFELKSLAFQRNAALQKLEEEIFRDRRALTESALKRGLAAGTLGKKCARGLWTIGKHCPSRISTAALRSQTAFSRLAEAMARWPQNRRVFFERPQPGSRAVQSRRNAASGAELN